MDNNTPRWWIQLLDRRDCVSDDQLKNIQSNFAVQAERLDLMIDREIVFPEIASYFSEGLITEPILNLLEKMEELDYRASMEILASLKLVYCEVAVYCTTIWLYGSSFKQGKYFEAVNRIWRGRIKGLESRQSELITDELKRCRDEIEAALYNAYARRRLVDRQTNMSHLVDVYLNEVLTIMDPSFVEVVLTQTEEGSGPSSVGLSLQSPEINRRESPREASFELRVVSEPLQDDVLPEHSSNQVQIGVGEALRSHSLELQMVEPMTEIVSGSITASTRDDIHQIDENVENEGSGSLEKSLHASSANTDESDDGDDGSRPNRAGRSSLNKLRNRRTQKN